jgi:tetratricopeptide (TPR) repeat protein
MRFKSAHEQARGQWRNAYWPVIDPHLFLGEDDSELLLARGALNETTWRIEHQEGRSVQFEGDLGKADAAFRRALALDPRLEEAQLRLGRVLALRGQTDAALAALAGLQPGSADAGLACLARLFEGDVYEGRGDIGRAEAAYRAAASSWLSAARVIDAAKRSDLVVYALRTPPAPPTAPIVEVRDIRPDSMQRRRPGIPISVPQETPNRPDKFLQAIAEETGGQLRTVKTDTDLTAAFTAILGEFRERYVLSYLPEGVPSGGWHQLSVRVKGQKATVTARRGYFAD